MLKRLSPKKLQFTTTTIRILSEDDQKVVVGGAPDTRSPFGSSACSKDPRTC